MNILIIDDDRTILGLLEKKSKTWDMRSKQP